MSISELWRYPVKSMAGERLQEASLRVYGIPGDRAVYVIDARGEILSARSKPNLLEHHATLDDHAWTSCATSVPPLTEPSP